MRVYLFLVGYCEMEVEKADGTRFFELCRSGGFSPSRVWQGENGVIRLRFTLHTSRAVREAAEAAGVRLTVCNVGGLPQLLHRFLHRPGLIAGVILAAALLTASPLFLWDVEVTGNETLSSEELLAELREAGLDKGAFLPNLDTDALAIALRRVDPRIAYVSVNLNGTVADVQIREAEPTPPSSVTTPANLVAKCDGVVILPIIFEGKCLVRAGDVVRAGDILASGLMSTENNGLRITRSAGEVLARTTHTYTVTVPFDYEEKVYTGKRGHELSISFFGHTGNFLKTTGKLEGECDIIESSNWLHFLLTRALPIGFSSVTALEYTMVPAHRTGVEALREAESQLAAILAADSAGRTMLSRTVETQMSETGVTLICTVVAEENIAVVAEFAAE